MFAIERKLSRLPELCVHRAETALGLIDRDHGLRHDFDEPMTAASEVGANIFTTATKVANGLLLRARRRHGGEHASAVELSELPRIPPVGLDAFAGLYRNEREQ